jgi:glutathione S-transferase
MLKLHYSPTSPFVRKCVVAAHELHIIDQIELIPASAHPVNRDMKLVALNPLGKLPTLEIDGGTTLYDSRVICEYLNVLAGGNLIPAQGEARWAALVGQALADGLMDAAVLTRYEKAARPEKLQWEEWVSGQLAKVTSALAEIERRANTFAERVDVGTISIACALGYLDFRYANLAWRNSCPTAAAWFERFGARESMAATRAPST